MATIARMMVEVGANVARLQTDMNKATGIIERSSKTMASAFKVVGVAFAGAFSLRAVQGAINDVLKMADATAKLSQSVGVSVETLSSFKHAADLSGTTIDSVGRGLGQLSKNMLDMANGTGEAQVAFRALGISVQNSQGALKNSDEVMGEIADRFAKMEDGAAKTALAMRVFGKSGKDMIPMLNQGSAGIAEMREEAEKLGLVMSTAMAQQAERVNDNLTRMSGAFRGIVIQVVDGLLPTFEHLSNIFLNFTSRQEEAEKAAVFLSNALKVLVSSGVVVKSIFSAVGDTLAAVASAIMFVIEGEFRLAWESLKMGATDVAEGMAKSFETITQIWDRAAAESIRSTMGMRESLKTLKLDMDSLKDSSGGYEEVFKSVNDAIFALNATTAELATRKLEQQIEKWAKAAGKVTPELQAMLDLFRKISTEMIIDAALDEAFGDLEVPKAAVRDLAAELQELQEIIDPTIRIAREMSEVFDQLGDMLSAGLIDDKQFGAMYDAIERIKTGGEEIRDTFKLAAEESRKAFLIMQRAFDSGSQGYKAMEVAIQASNAALAIQAVLNQAGGDPYTAFARMAAMAAAVASLGQSVGSFMGGGEGSGPTGPTASAVTGTVLGDASAASQSAQNAYDMLEKYNDLQYVELRGIHGQMKSLNQNLTGLANAIVRGVGSFGAGSFPGLSVGATSPYDTNNMLIPLMGGNLGILGRTMEETLGESQISNFLNLADRAAGAIIGALAEGILGGSVKQEMAQAGIEIGQTSVGALMDGMESGIQQYGVVWNKKSGGWFGSSQVWFSEVFAEATEDTERLFGGLYSDIASILKSLGDAFGVELEIIRGYEIQMQRINLLGMSGEEVQKALGAWVSTLMDIAVEDLFGELISKYQKIDEGLLETATRLITGLSVVQSLAEQTRTSFEAIGMAAYDISEALIDAAGGLDALSESVSKYYKEFITKGEQQQDLFKNLEQTFEALGISMPATRDGFRSLVEGLDLTTSSGRQLYVALMSIAEGMGSVYSAQENIDKSIDGLIAGFESALNPLDAYGKIIEDVTKKVDSAMQVWIDNGMSLEDAMSKGAALTEKYIGAFTRQLREQEEAARLAQEQSERERAAAEWRAQMEAYESARIAKANAIREERMGLERQLLILEENTAELRRRDLAALDASNRALQQRIWAIEDERAAIESLTRAVDDTRSVFRGFVQTELSQSQSSVNEWSRTAENLRQYRASMMTGRDSTLRPDELLSESLKQFREGETGDLTKLADNLLSAAKGALTDAGQYAAIFSEVQQRIMEAELEAYEQVDLAQQQVDALQRQIDFLDSLDDTAKDIYEALQRYQDALIAAINAGQTQYSGELVGAGFASGGIATGPQSGYWERLHGTEAVIPLSGGPVPVVIQGDGDEETKQLLRALIAEVTEDKTLSRKIYRVLDRVTAGEDSLQTRAAD